jgi:hypothetical protein
MADQDVLTPLGYLRGEMEVEGIPKELTTIYPQVVAVRDDGQSTAVNVPPGQIYAMPLAPGHYKVHAQFGTAKSADVDITIQNAQTATVDFAFGKDAG